MATSVCASRKVTSTYFLAFAPPAKHPMPQLHQCECCHLLDKSAQVVSSGPPPYFRWQYCLRACVDTGHPGAWRGVVDVSPCVWHVDKAVTRPRRAATVNAPSGFNTNLRSSLFHRKIIFSNEKETRNYSKNFVLLSKGVAS